MPLISIIMSVYKPDEKGLLRTVTSVLEQSYSKYEFIIIQDDIEKKTETLLEQINDTRVVILKNSSNLGLVKSLNKGLLHAKGAYIARIDVDDWWEINKLKLQLEVMLEKALVLTGTQVNYVDVNLNPLKKYKTPSTNESLKSVLESGKNPFTHSSVMFKNFEKISYNEKALHTEDFELWCRYYFLGNMEILPLYLTNYVIDINGITGTKRYLMFINAMKVYERFMYHLKNNKSNLIKDGLIEEPQREMSHQEILFSRYYSRGINHAFRGEKIKYYYFLVISLLINPKIIYYNLKKKYIYYRYKFLKL